MLDAPPSPPLPPLFPADTFGGRLSDAEKLELLRSSTKRVRHQAATPYVSPYNSGMHQVRIHVANQKTVISSKWRAPRAQHWHELLTVASAGASTSPSPRAPCRLIIGPPWPPVPLLAAACCCLRCQHSSAGVNSHVTSGVLSAYLPARNWPAPQRPQSACAQSHGLQRPDVVASPSSLARGGAGGQAAETAAPPSLHSKTSTTGPYTQFEQVATFDV
jgi:hypothetical protein